MSAEQVSAWLLAAAVRLGACGPEIAERESDGSPAVVDANGRMWRVVMEEF